MSTAATVIAVSLALAACSDATTTSTTPGEPMTSEPTTIARRDTAAVNGTTLAVARIGDGPPVLLIHGGGEDASMLAAQAASLAEAGFEAIVYDRRGTGESGRNAWPARPEAAADQHADDAAALIDELGLVDPIVVGASSGGVVALRLAVRHGGRVGRVIAWEPPLAGQIPGGAELSAQIMQPITEHLAEHPDDFAGAQALLLSFVLGFPVAADDPAFAATRVNAEPMVRDDPNITLAAVAADELAGRDVTVAIGSEPNELIAAAAGELATIDGIDVVHVEGSHEIYLTDPNVLTGIVIENRS
jgi:pimeloyl-ACP methyl ester carboxylesterase